MFISYCMSAASRCRSGCSQNNIGRYIICVELHWNRDLLESKRHVIGQQVPRGS
jgi:hypothetical protein